MNKIKHSVDDYGLVLNMNILNCLATKICDDYSDEDWNVFEKRCKYVDEVVEKLDLVVVDNFTGGVVSVLDDYKFDTPNWLEYNDYYENDKIYYITTLYKVSFDIINEFVSKYVERAKDVIGKYFPDNFDYNHRVCHIVGYYET